MDTSLPPPPPVQNPNNYFVVTRQPLFPSSPKEAVAEASKTQGNTRRANFAATSERKRLMSDANNNEEAAPTPASVPGSAPRFVYSRSELLDIGDAGVCQQPVESWPQIAADFPSLLRKVGSQPFKPQREFNFEMFDNALRSSAMVADEDDAAGHASSSSPKVVKKKNFLEVLRPDAPVRQWSEELGEWVEVGSPGEGASEATRA